MLRAHLVDISAVFFRYYFAPTPIIENDEGWDIAALLFSIRWLCQRDFFHDDLTLAAFDESLGSGFRHEIDEDYKANRALPTDDIVYQLSALKVFCEYLGFVVVASETLEADDLIGAASVQLDQYKTIIHSRDKDLRQLLSPSVSMKDIMTDKVWDEATLLNDSGLTPVQVPLYLAMMGDSSDNIMGLPGIGDKTARALLHHYKDWNGIKLAAHSNEKLPIRGSDRICRTLIEYETLVDHNLKLTALKTDDPLDFTCRPFNYENYTMFVALADQFGMQNKLKKAFNIISEFIK